MKITFGEKFEYKKLNEKSIDKILQLQSEIVNELLKNFKGKELFFSNNKDELYDIINGNKNLGIGLFRGKELVGYGVITKDVSCYKGNTILDFDEGKTAQVDIIAISPEYQGQNFGSELLRELEYRYLDKYKKITTLLATVSPYNINSLKLFLKNGYFVNGLFKKHNKFYSTIMRKEIKN